jgi:mono/diheme cytochrome c family protein
MKKLNWHYILSLSGALMIFISGCSKSNNSGSSLYTPASSDVTPTATLIDLQQGRTLYMNNCNACHGLYSPDDYTPGQWKSIISIMGSRTGLPASDIALITKYVSRGQ